MVKVICKNACVKLYKEIILYYIIQKMETKFITYENMKQYNEIILEYSKKISEENLDLNNEMDALCMATDEEKLQSHISKVWRICDNYYNDIKDYFDIDECNTDYFLDSLDINDFLGFEIAKGEKYNVLNKVLCHDIVANILSYIKKPQREPIDNNFGLN